MRIEVGSVLEAFDAAIELIEDEDERARFERVINASRDSVQRAVHDVVSQIVDEVNEAADGVVQLVLAYGADGLDLNVEATLPEEVDTAEAGISFTFDEGDIERLTLRLPAELKELAARHAEGSGVSLNTWLTRLVSHEAGRRERGERRRRRGGRGRGSGQSLKGWIGS